MLLFYVLLKSERGVGLCEQTNRLVSNVIKAFYCSCFNIPFKMQTACCPLPHFVA